jgi:hypothetical protein
MLQTNVNVGWAVSLMSRPRFTSGSIILYFFLLRLSKSQDNDAAEKTRYIENFSDHHYTGQESCRVFNSFAKITFFSSALGGDSNEIYDKNIENLGMQQI